MKNWILLSLLGMRCFITDAAVIENVGLLLPRSEKMTQEKWDQDTAGLTRAGLCRNYASFAISGLGTCQGLCGDLAKKAQETGKTQSVTCFGSGEDGAPKSRDLQGNEYGIGICLCSLPLLEIVITDVILTLPAIAEFGCTLLFAAFDLVLQTAVSWIPGVGAAISAGLKAGIQAAKSISESGLDSGAFQNWYSGICGAGKYALLAANLFNPLSVIPDEVVFSCGLKKCPGKKKPGDGDKKDESGSKGIPENSSIVEQPKTDPPSPPPTVTKDNGGDQTTAKPARTSTSDAATPTTTSDLACELPRRKRALDPNEDPPRCDLQKHIHRTITTKTTESLTTPPITCSRAHTQACYHYRSVMSVHSAMPDMVRWTCGKTNSDTASGIATDLYGVYGRNGRTGQHHPQWVEGWTEAQEIKKDELGKCCHRDEWPPRKFWPNSKNKKEGQRIRYLPAGENSGAGSLWAGFCDERMAKDENGKKNSKVVVSTIDKKEEVTTVGGKTTTITSVYVQLPIPVFEIKHWELDSSPDDGLELNPCWPKELVPDDPGFALLTDDEWYKDHPQQAKATGSYAKPPSDAILKGKLKLYDDAGLGFLSGMNRLVDEIEKIQDKAFKAAQTKGNTGDDGEYKPGRQGYDKRELLSQDQKTQKDCGLGCGTLVPTWTKVVRVQVISVDLPQEDAGKTILRV